MDFTGDNCKYCKRGVYEAAAFLTLNGQFRINDKRCFTHDQTNQNLGFRVYACSRCGHATMQADPAVIKEHLELSKKNLFESCI